MTSLNRKLFRDLMRLRMQGVTIALVVACGSAALIAALSTYYSLRSARDEYYERAHFAEVFASVKSAPRGVVAELRELPGIADVEARVIKDVTLDLPNVPLPAVGHLVGLSAREPPQINRLLLREGRWISADRDNEALVSEAFASANRLRPGDQLRALMNGKYQQLLIVGIALSPEFVYALRAGDPLPDDRHYGIVWVNEAGLSAAFDLTGACNDFAIRLAPGASVRSVIAQLDARLAAYGSSGAYGRSEQVSHRFITDEIAQQGIMATTIPPTFLAVAAFLLTVVLGRTIASQREQIATLKALGYDDRALVWHYLKFASIITLAGVIAGIALGAWLGRLMTDNYTQFFRFPILRYRLDAWIALLAAAVCMLAAVVAALGVVRQITGLAPADAMRPPSPRLYSRTIVDRWRVAQWLPAQGRLILRAIAGRPGRFALTVVGIALAIPITVTGLFWRDAIDYMIHVQFEQAQRADAIVQFTHPLNIAAAREIGREPGVTRVESLRSVAVRLRFGQHSYRTALIGLPSDAQLRRIVDERSGIIPLPAEGLVLTDRLAERLGVKIGSLITVEVQEEGARPIRDVKVVALTTEMIGLNGYMNIRALNRLMQEGELVSAVAIEVQKDQAERAYARIKTLPRVATLAVTEQSMRSFLQTTATFVLVFTGILTAFAVVIAIGVVYNNARIALAERAWELASLRVLGFTRAEVAQILLTEQAIPILLAIPLGLWLGYVTVWALVRAHVTEMFQIPPVIERDTYAWCAIVVLAAAVFSALIVSRRINRLDLVSVLKTRE